MDEEFDADIDSELSNYDWFVKHIGLARSRERLDFLAELIVFEKADDEGWTKDEECLRTIRDQWQKRYKVV